MKHIENPFSEGQVLLVNKPFEWTSFDVVRKIRYLTKTKKVGHAGTLDPLATGLLIVCTGKKTKQIEQFMRLEKEYTGPLMRGATTTCYDLEKPVDETVPTAHITVNMIAEAAASLSGVQMQV